MPTHHDVRGRVDTLTRDLLAFYADAWDRITREEQQIRDTWLTSPRPRRLARLEQLQATVEHLMDHADTQALAFVTGEIPRAYHYGAVDSGYPPLEWSKVDIDAVNHLASTTYDDMLTATRFVRTATKTLIRTLTRQQISAKLLTGQTARQAGRELEDVFARQGIAAVTYANGARVGLEQYASMLARTQSALAYNQGNYNQFAANDIGFVECFDNPECGLDGHEDEEKPNGQVYDLSVMEDYPISHPNCVRGWGTRPDITTAEEAAAADGTATDAQNADQAALSDAASNDQSAAEPDSVSAVAEQLVADATAAEPELTALTSDLAAENGGEMAGLDFRLKGVDSLTRKISADVADTGATPAEIGAKLFDVNRYTTVFSDEQYATGAQSTLNSLRDRGYGLNVKNYWNNPDNPYQGINVQITSPTGQRFELQFHTPTSLDIKEGELHRIYELARVTTDTDLLREYTAESFAAAAKIPIPDGVQSVG